MENLTPLARQALWSIFWMSIVHRQGTKKVATQEWDYVLRRLNLDFLEKGPDEYDPRVEVISDQYKHIFLKGQASEVIRILDIALERLHEARQLAGNGPYSLFRILDYWIRPKPRGNFARLVNNTFEEYGMPYYVDMSAPPTIVPKSTQIGEEGIKQALLILPQHGYSAADGHLRNSIERLKELDWHGSMQQSISALESVAVTLKPGPKQTLGSAIKAIKNKGEVHDALCEAMEGVWRYTNQMPGIRHGYAVTGVTTTMNEARLMLAICAAFSVYLVTLYGDGRNS